MTMRFLESLDIAAGVTAGDSEYNKQQKRQQYLQQQTEKLGKWATPPMPTLQKVPKCDGNSAAFACAAFAVLKILAITATAVTAIL